MSPTQRSLAYLRKEGYTPYITEHWNAYARIRKDLYGFIDIVALHPDKKGVLAIQTTSKNNVNARIQKIKSLPVYKLWLQAENKIEVHGWDKKEVKIVDITLNKLEEILE